MAHKSLNWKVFKTSAMTNYLTWFDGILDIINSISSIGKSGSSDPARLKKNFQSVSLWEQSQGSSYLPKNLLSAIRYYLYPSQCQGSSANNFFKFLVSFGDLCILNERRNVKHVGHQSRTTFYSTVLGTSALPPALRSGPSKQVCWCWWGRVESLDIAPRIKEGNKHYK